MKHLRKNTAFIIAIIMLFQSATITNAEVLTNEMISEENLIKISGITMPASDLVMYLLVKLQVGKVIL